MHRTFAVRACGLAVALAAAWGTPAAFAQQEIRIAHVYSKTGPLLVFG